MDREARTLSKLLLLGQQARKVLATLFSEQMIPGDCRGLVRELLDQWEYEESNLQPTQQPVIVLTNELLQEESEVQEERPIERATIIKLDKPGSLSLPDRDNRIYSPSHVAEIVRSQVGKEKIAELLLHLNKVGRDTHFKLLRVVPPPCNSSQLSWLFRGGPFQSVYVGGKIHWMAREISSLWTEELEQRHGPPVVYQEESEAIAN